jgi:hypothetical protein
MRLGSNNGNSTAGSVLSWSSAPCPSLARVPDSPVFTNGLCNQEKGMLVKFADFLFIFSKYPLFLSFMKVLVLRSLEYRVGHLSNRVSRDLPSPPPS